MIVLAFHLTLFFSKNFPNGILLSELLSEKELVEAINKINNE